MFIDKALNDHSANLARKILEKGLNRLSYILKKEFGSEDFTYIACPDFSITLRQRRLFIGLPIGGYINWSKYSFFPLELDVNSCGVHVIKLPKTFDPIKFRHRLQDLKSKLDGHQLEIDGKKLKWNFSRRNHFINIYHNSENTPHVVIHSSGETILFDWDYLKSNFSIKTVEVDGRSIPYLLNKDFDKYWSIASKENQFFFERHKYIFSLLFDDDYEIIYSDQHFGMINAGEILMGCSKVPVGSVFPILTKPFKTIYLAKALAPSKEILQVTNNNALVPHGMGMTVSDDIIEISPDEIGNDYAFIKHKNGSYMVTDTLEYIGIRYRDISYINKMAKKALSKSLMN